MLHSQSAGPFARTLGALFRTFEVLGVEEDTLVEDATFLTDTFKTCKQSIVDVPTEKLHEVMDLCFIGLIYHRHMPFIDDSTGERVVGADLGQAEYMHTMRLLGVGLAGLGITRAQVQLAAMAGALLMRSIIEDPSERDLEDDPILSAIMSMAGLGMVVHTLLPGTSERPDA